MKHWVLPHSAVDNSDLSPSCLTFPLNGPYSTFLAGNGPSCSSQAKRIRHELLCVSALILSHLLSGAAVCPLLAPSWSRPVESSCQATQQAPPSAQASLSTRLPRLSSRLHCLV